MTRKDYVAIASVFAGMRADGFFTTDSGDLMFLEERVAGVLAADNDRFDRDHFLRACRGE